MSIIIHFMENNMIDLLHFEFYNNSVIDYMIALLITLFIYFILVMVKWAIAKRLLKLVKKSRTDIDDFTIELIGQIKKIFIFFISIYIGSSWLDIADKLVQLIQLATLFSLLFQIGFWLNALITFLIKRRVKRAKGEDAGEDTTLNVVGILAKYVVWVVITLLALDNVPGVQIDSLIASLGIAGIAIGLAVQNILGDLFASITIALDRPFVIGDFIEVGDLSGTVEQIGLKSIRIRSLSGEQLIFSASDLLASRVRNFQNMERRRVVFKFGVTYQTPYNKLAAIPTMIREIIEGFENVTFDRAHFKNYDDSSLDFEIVYWMEVSDFALYMDTQQAINLETFRLFEEQSIDFAYPTRTIFIEK